MPGIIDNMNGYINKDSTQQQTLTLLYQNSLGSIPFNIALATFLSLDLLHTGISSLLIGSWFALICIMSIIRWFYSRRKLTQEIRRAKIKTELYKFSALTFLMGALWGSCYFIFVPHINSMQELIILLVFAGMSAGGMTSLSGYLPAFFAFIFPIMIPLIIYNLYLFQEDRVMMSVMFILFMLMLMVSAKLNNKLMIENFTLGKEKDWLIKKLSLSNSNLEDSNEKLLHSIEEVRMMSITDALTGLYNRRHFNAMLHNELDRARRNGHMLNLVLIDIDNFKYVNDTFGHPYGDEYLIKTATSLKTCIRRSTDILFRLGGDEFAAILSNISPEETNVISNQIQQQFKEDIQNDKISLSIGIISIPPGYGFNLKQIIAQADHLLYEAKRKGKNQISHIILHT